MGGFVSNRLWDSRKPMDGIRSMNEVQRCIGKQSVVERTRHGRRIILPV